MLKVLGASRRKPRVGDVFAYQLEREANLYRFGRVVMTDAAVGPIKDMYLIYTYIGTSADRFSIPPLDVNSLLIPPLIINRLPWSRGYFSYIKNVDFAENERFDDHVFADYRDWYFDASGRRLVDVPDGVPIAKFGLNSYQTFAEKVELALESNHPRGAEREAEVRDL